MDGKTKLSEVAKKRVNENIIITDQQMDEWMKHSNKRKWWQFKMPHKYVIYDKIHRGAVYLTISFCTIFFLQMVTDSWHYNRVRKPVMIEIARLDKEAEMFRMQKEREAALKKQKNLKLPTE